MQPPLASANIPPRPLRGADRRRAFAHNWVDAIPASAYDEAVHVMPSMLGSAYLVSDPEGVRRVLLDGATAFTKHAIHATSVRMVFGNGLLGAEGEVWRSHRRLMAPAFEPRAVAGYAPTMTTAIDSFLAGWDEADDDAPFDVFEAMLGLALRIISTTMFSTDSEAIMALAGEAMQRALLVRPNLLIIVPLLSKLVEAGQRRQVADVFGRLDAAVHDLIAERSATPGQSRDLLSLLLAARDDDTGARLTPTEVRDQVVTIFLAGHETTAVALGWTWYVLSQRPEAEARLHAELDAVLGGREPTLDDLPKLTFTRALVQEVMRLYPPVPNLLSRRASQTETIAGVRIPRGAMVFITPWIIHRHRRLWDRPDDFDPDRFLGPAPPRFAYIPFGAGPRTCIGLPLAMAEIQLALAAIAQRWRLTLASDAPVELQHRITLRPAAPMLMTRERRLPR